MPVDFLAELKAVPLVAAVLWGVLHGLTPHGHSWLVLLPFALGGLSARNMARLAVAYGAGMVVVAAVIGALLGFVSHVAIPEAWHRGLELGIGGVLAALGLLFMVHPASVHHAVDHICGEHCHSDGEQQLVRKGSMAALFVVGVLSMLVPCPTNAPLYLLSAQSRSVWGGMALFTLYALVTSITVGIVAVGMARTRRLLAPLESPSSQRLIMRLSGIIVLAAGAYMLWLGTHTHTHGPDEHDHDDHGARPAAVWVAQARE